MASVISAAARVFVTHGYRRAQVQDVADELGVAKGTVYAYAAGKEALFAAAIRYGDGLEPLPGPAELPLATVSPDAVAALVAERLGGEVARLALAGDSAASPVGLGDVVLDLYTRLARHRVAIKIVDRCAAEFPQLARVWFGDGRQAQVGALESYLARRSAAGSLVLPGPPPLVARTVVEVCALWAVHCHFDPAASTADVVTDIDDHAVAAMLATIFDRATSPHETSPGD
jgi:AcrR family transcriptional regulator